MFRHRIPRFRDSGGRNDGGESRIQRGGAADQQSIALGAAEREIGDHLGNAHLADQRSAGLQHMHAVAGARPDAAVAVEPDAVLPAGRTFFADHARGAE